jgi:uncharacterized protein YecT (DUF1311 family)
MLSKAIILSAVALAFSAVGSAQDAARPIDAAMAECLEIHKGNMPRVKCYSDASQAWTKEVDDKYTALQSLVPANLLDIFKDSQAAWVRYRDAEWRFLDTKNAKQTGTGHIAERVIERMAPVRERAIFFDDLYETYKR